MRLKLEPLDEHGHPKRRNRQIRDVERFLRKNVAQVAKERGLSPDDVVARLDVNQFMERLTMVMEFERALQQCGLSPQELATWFDSEGAPHFGNLIRRLFGT
jgi:hypothetical protein